MGPLPGLCLAAEPCYLLSQPSLGPVDGQQAWFCLGPNFANKQSSSWTARLNEGLCSSRLA